AFANAPGGIATSNTVPESPVSATRSPSAIGSSASAAGGSDTAPLNASVSSPPGGATFPSVSFGPVKPMHGSSTSTNSLKLMIATSQSLAAWSQHVGHAAGAGVQSHWFVIATPFL